MRAIVVNDPEAIVREAGGEELVERLRALDALATRATRAEPAEVPPVAASPDVDVVVAGGGLWSLLAPILADRGLRVIVVERARTGAAHREWNASGPELSALVSAGLVSAEELSSLVVARYTHGTCRFHGGRAWPVTGVLDHAVDAGALLEHARRLGDARGVQYLDRTTVIGHAEHASTIRVRLCDHAGTERDVVARVLVDARGAASPYAVADLICPTVGGVVAGLASGGGDDEIDPTVGEILATVEGIEDGRQHVWEAFPGRAGETTVYLFYYARAEDRGSLLSLYARFFDRLGTFKRGEPRLLRPTFGLIPGWSRLSAAPTPPRDTSRMVLVGDAAARHSPLTYCGFGATLRSLTRAADTVLAMANGAPRPACAVDDAPAHALTGALAYVMTTRAFEGGELNALLDDAFGALHGMGNDAYAALLRDEIDPRSFLTFLRETARRHPAVWGKVARSFGPIVAGRWGLGLARSMLASTP